ncbi:MAG: DNA methyltransferase, partial [Armatimonadetes bacterium]|nr:DNA methyltransferase [Armatimonadota bacterium]
MHPLEAYLREVRDIRSSGGGVEETSYYGPLAALLNTAGAALSPRVRCIVNVRNLGAGVPDGGFFTTDQFPRVSSDDPAEGQIPSRGALEVKGLGEDIAEVATSEQVEKYRQRYGQVLV